MEQGSVVPSSGKPITAGDIVGDVGLTGFRTGLHFHVQFGSQTVRLNNDGLGPNSTVADASLSGPRPVFETATGEIIRGIVSQVSYDISTKSLGTGQHNLTLLGTLSINGTGDKYDNTISGNLGNNRLSGLDGNDKIYGGDGNDSISGGTGNDTLDGGANNDTLSGDAGNDKMYGQLGNDSISGGTDRDTIDGGAGNDTINGGAGQDFVTGGAGADVFVIASAGDSRAGAGDTIFDFFSAGATQYPGSPAGDRIRVSSIDFDSTKSGFQNPTLIGNQPFHGVAGEMRLSNGLVQVDFDGDKRADFEIKIPGMTSLKASDWIFD